MRRKFNKVLLHDGSNRLIPSSITVGYKYIRYDVESILYVYGVTGEENSPEIKVLLSEYKLPRPKDKDGNYTLWLTSSTVKLTDVKQMYLLIEVDNSEWIDINDMQIGVLESSITSSNVGDSTGNYGTESLVITSFKLNNGEIFSSNQGCPVSFTSSRPPTHFRLSKLESFADTEWTIISAFPSVVQLYIAGVNTFYLQIKDSEELSNVAHSSVGWHGMEVSFCVDNVVFNTISITEEVTTLKIPASPVGCEDSVTMIAIGVSDSIDSLICGYEIVLPLEDVVAPPVITSDNDGVTAVCSGCDSMTYTTSNEVYIDYSVYPPVPKVLKPTKPTPSSDVYTSELILAAPMHVAIRSWVNGIASAVVYKELTNYETVDVTEESAIITMSHSNQDVRIFYEYNATEMPSDVTLSSNEYTAPIAAQNGYYRVSAYYMSSWSPESTLSYNVYPSYAGIQQYEHFDGSTAMSLSGSPTYGVGKWSNAIQVDYSAYAYISNAINDINQAINLWFYTSSADTTTRTVLHIGNDYNAYKLECIVRSGNVVAVRTTDRLGTVREYTTTVNDGFSMLTISINTGWVDKNRFKAYVNSNEMMNSGEGLDVAEIAHMRGNNTVITIGRGVTANSSTVGIDEFVLWSDIHITYTDVVVLYNDGNGYLTP